MKTKALSPGEVRKLNEPEKKTVEALVEQVNEFLKRDFKGDSGYHGDRVSITAAALGVNDRIRNAVVAEFRKAGWAVEFHDDQRDGAYYLFIESTSAAYNAEMNGQR
jgi:hypothetical protein